MDTLQDILRSKGATPVDQTTTIELVEKFSMQVTLRSKGAVSVDQTTITELLEKFGVD